MMQRVIIFCLFIGLLSCTVAPENVQEPPQIGFYHWQQRLEQDSLNTCLLEAVSAEELHVKFFDVVWNSQRAAPSARLEAKVDSTFQLAIIPVVFITNEVMREIDPIQLPSLANDILNEITSILEESFFKADSLAEDYQSSKAPIGSSTDSISQKKGERTTSLHVLERITELQIDCDWTATTRDKYFAFLKTLRKWLPPAAELSATVRLHQFKDQAIQGVPPIDRGVLMAYNVGDLSRWDTRQSQLDTTITAAYLRPDKKYPLPLDIALPYYQWGVIYREEKLAYLINELTATALSDTSRFTLLTANRYQVRQATYLNGYYLYAQDLIRLEVPDQPSLLTLANQLRLIPPFSGQRLLFYHLGSRLSSQCNHPELKALQSAYFTRIDGL